MIVEWTGIAICIKQNFWTGVRGKKVLKRLVMDSVKDTDTVDTARCA